MGTITVEYTEPVHQGKTLPELEAELLALDNQFKALAAASPEGKGTGESILTSLMTKFMPHVSKILPGIEVGKARRDALIEVARTHAAAQLARRQRVEAQALQARIAELKTSIDGHVRFLANYGAYSTSEAERNALAAGVNRATIDRVAAQIEALSKQEAASV